MYYAPMIHISPFLNNRKTSEICQTPVGHGKWMIPVEQCEDC